MKQKKEAKKPKGQTQQNCLKSHFLGFGEGDGDGLASTSCVQYGYQILEKAIAIIMRGGMFPYMGW